MLIQGITLAGVFFDEVALMPRSFVEQALARTISYEKPKFFFNCNPESPNHYFYKEWIEEQKPGTRHIHFLLEDNPILTEQMIERTKAMYSGVFYDRYIRGLWVLAEGLIYPMFDQKRHVLQELPETEGDYYVSSDFGIQNATVFLLWRRVKGSKAWLCVNEYYYSGRDENKQKTVSELVDGLKTMLGDIVPRKVIVDPSAAALIAELRKNGYHTQAAVNDVMNGISDVCTMLNDGNLLFSDRCVNTIKEFGLYMWDEKAAERGEDAPVKTSDHAMDAIRYFVKTMHLVQKQNRQEYTPIWG
jgi:PBSX family phage terminase large subunit